MDKLPSQILEEIVSEIEIESGVRFECDEGDVKHFIRPPHAPITISEDDLIKWAVSEGRVGFNPLRKDLKYRKWLLEAAKSQYDLGRVGGLDMSAFNLKEVERYLPGIGRIINEETGKVGFIGNGLSDVPLIVAERYKKREVFKIPVIADMFSFELLHMDMKKMERRYEARGLKFPYEKELGKLARLVEAIEDGYLVAVKYFFGSDALPNTLKNCVLVINRHGPPSSTINEQLQMLSPSGQLYYSSVGYEPGELKVPKGFRLYELDRHAKILRLENA